MKCKCWVRNIRWMASLRFEARRAPCCGAAPPLHVVPPAPDAKQQHKHRPCDAPGQQHFSWPGLGEEPAGVGRGWRFPHAWTPGQGALAPTCTCSAPFACCQLHPKPVEQGGSTALEIMAGGLEIMAGGQAEHCAGSHPLPNLMHTSVSTSAMASASQANVPSLQGTGSQFAKRRRHGESEGSFQQPAGQANRGLCAAAAWPPSSPSLTL